MISLVYHFFAKDLSLHLILTNKMMQIVQSVI